MTSYHAPQSPEPPWKKGLRDIGCLGTFYGGALLLASAPVWLPVAGAVFALLFSISVLIFMATTFLVYPSICVVAYLRTLIGMMGEGGTSNPAPVAAPGRGSDSEEPAYLHYLFKQVFIDVRYMAREGLFQPWQVIDSHIHRVREYSARIRFSFFRVAHRYFAWLVTAGMQMGTYLGFAVVVVLFVIQLLALVVLAASCFIGIGVLRGADTLLLRIKQIKIKCSSCHLRVPYPSYECPAPGCGRLHKDVRPGRYGMFKRVCACGTAMPTLLLTGSGKLKAHCPYCKGSLARNVGEMREIVIPVLGGVAAGKTRLMTALVMALCESGRLHGVSAAIADEESQAIYARFRDALVAGTATAKTGAAALPRPYSLHVRPARSSPRLLHLFDAPGEFVRDSESLRKLQYMREARTFLFTLDPLRIDAIWDALTPAQQARLVPLRSDDDPYFAFGQVVQNIEGHGVPIRRARLAVALTKDDLVRSSPAASGLGEDSAAIEAWLQDEAGLGGLVRLMRRSFGQVHFFRTSAWLDGGVLAGSIIDLAAWILAQEGIRVEPAVRSA